MREKIQEALEISGWVELFLTGWVGWSCCSRENTGRMGIAGKRKVREIRYLGLDNQVEMPVGG